jgi:hypothetical protein
MISWAASKRCTGWVLVSKWYGNNMKVFPFFRINGSLFTLYTFSMGHMERCMSATEGLCDEMDAEKLKSGNKERQSIKESCLNLSTTDVLSARFAIKGEEIRARGGGET